MANKGEKLREAAKNGSDVEIKALLRDPGCGSMSKDASGQSALVWAARYGHESCVQLLLPVSDVLTKDEGGLTALMHAALHGRESCVRLLLPVSDTLAGDNDGMSALMWAAYAGHEACVGLLLPRSAALATDASGRTASQWARKYGLEGLALSIDAYALAQSEKASIQGAVSSGTARQRMPSRL